MSNGFTDKGLPRGAALRPNDPDLQLLFSSLYFHGALTQDPENVRPGEMWLRSDLTPAELRGNVNGSTITLATAGGGGGSVEWGDITETPTTFTGYGLDAALASTLSPFLHKVGDPTVRLGTSDLVAPEAVAVFLQPDASLEAGWIVVAAQNDPGTGYAYAQTLFAKHMADGTWRYLGAVGADETDGGARTIYLYDAVNNNTVYLGSDSRFHLVDDPAGGLAFGPLAVARNGAGELEVGGDLKVTGALDVSSIGPIDLSVAGHAGVGGAPTTPAVTAGVVLETIGRLGVTESSAGVGASMRFYLQGLGQKAEIVVAGADDDAHSPPRFLQGDLLILPAAGQKLVLDPLRLNPADGQVGVNASPSTTTLLVQATSEYHRVLEVQPKPGVAPQDDVLRINDESGVRRIYADTDLVLHVGLKDLIINDSVDPDTSGVTPTLVARAPVFSGKPGATSLLGYLHLFDR